MWKCTKTENNHLIVPRIFFVPSVLYLTFCFGSTIFFYWIYNFHYTLRVFSRTVKMYPSCLPYGETHSTLINKHFFSFLPSVWVLGIIRKCTSTKFSFPKQWVEIYENIKNDAALISSSRTSLQETERAHPRDVVKFVSW